jgi:hypothetical protein
MRSLFKRVERLEGERAPADALRDMTDEELLERFGELAVLALEDWRAGRMPLYEVEPGLRGAAELLPSFRALLTGQELHELGL